MAWWSLYKWFVTFRKTPFTNYINYYRNKLYEDWFNSLTDEEKDKVYEIRKRNKLKEKQDLARAWQTLSMMMVMTCNKIQQ